MKTTRAIVQTLVPVILVLSLGFSPLAGQALLVSADSSECSVTRSHSTSSSERYNVPATCFTESGWAIPVPSTTEGNLITSTNYDYDSPIYLSNHGFRHGGVDWVGPHDSPYDISTPVYAIGAGTIRHLVRDDNPTANNSRLHIEHSAGNGAKFLAIYGHTYAPSSLSVGDVVSQGQQIGTLRQYESPIHLHFELNTVLTTTSYGGVKEGTVNPLQFLIDNPASGSTIDLALVSCHSQKFPFVYLTVRASSDGQPLSDLTKDDFSVTEDGRPQTDMFDVVPPEEGGGVRMADVVFLIDTSGSMGGQIAAVRDNCVAFADALAASDIDYRLGLVEFGQSAGGGHPRIIGGGLTASASEFQSWVAALYTSGGYEPGFAAIRLAIQSYNFRPGAQKVFILITDEDSDCRDKHTTIDMILANDVTVHVAALCSYGTSQADYCGPGSVRDVSGGLLFPVNGDYRSILDTIGEAVANAYIVRYRTDNPALDGSERTVVCTVQRGTATDFVQFTYVPGGAPHIQRTEETLALHAQSLVAAASPVISVIVTDAVAPFVQDVFLYVRTSGSGTGYVQISMSPQGNDIYSAAAPAGHVDAPGLDYYIRATDGQVTSSDPTTDPDTNPYQIAVLPNEAPVIVHTPPASWQAGSDIALDISASDSTYGVASLDVYYRKQGDLLWQSVSQNYDPPVTSISENVLLPVASWNTQVVEYYITVTDDLGVSKFSPEGAADEPHSISTAVHGGAMPLITSPLTMFSSRVHYPYIVGDALAAAFGITNRGDDPITFDVLVVGGRIDDEVVDFDRVHDITLHPGDTYDYFETKVLQMAGMYQFFCAYYIENPTDAEKELLDENNWNTSIIVEIDGTVIDDPDHAERYRAIGVAVLDDVVYIAPPMPRLWHEITGPWEEVSEDAGYRYEIKQVVAETGVTQGIYVVVQYKKLGFGGIYWPKGEDIFKLSAGEWSTLSDGLPSLWINTIAVAPSDPNVIYVGGEGRGVYESANGGASWVSLAGPKGNPRILSLAVCPIDPHTVYAGTESGGWKKKGEEPWDKIVDHVIIQMKTDPHERDIIYASRLVKRPGAYGSRYEPGGVLKSIDGGDTWKRLWTKGPGIDISGVAEEKSYVATASYLEKFPLPGLTDHAEIPVPIFADGILRFDGGDWGSRNSWHDARGRDGQNPLPDRSPRSVAAHPNFPNLVFVAFYREGIFYSPNSGNDWFPIGLRYSYDGEFIVESFVVADSDSTVLYAYGSKRVFRAELSDSAIIAKAYSPVELRVYDSQGNVTGKVYGEPKDGIPNSIWYDETVTIFSSGNLYRYNLVGVHEGSYGLEIILTTGAENLGFAATGIPTMPGAIHSYAIDWDALASGEDGVTVSVDSDGDGEFERTFTAGSTLAAIQTGTGSGTAFFTPSDGVIENLEALPVPDNPPSGYAFPHGLFSFNVTDLDYDGQTVALTIDLPTAVPPGTKWWKYHDGQWHDYNIPITIDGNTITITLTDGSIGDIDGVADGIITDPGGPGLRAIPPVGGTVYPISRLTILAPWILLATIMAGACMLVLRRRRVQV